MNKDAASGGDRVPTTALGNDRAQPADPVVVQSATGQPVSLRERQARAAYAVYSNKCLVPFEEQGDLMRATIYALVDSQNDCLTAPPSEASIMAGIAMLRGSESGPETGPYALYDPIGWYRRMVERIWETLVRTMLEGR